MPSAEYDLRYLRAGVSVLQDYLLSSEIYWPPGIRSGSGEPPYPQLTLGGMLLAQARVHARPLTTEQRAELARLDEQMDEVRARWRVAWGQKATNEFRARSGLWRDFLEDYREHPDANLDRYAYEVQRRVMLHLLAPDADAVPTAEANMLDALDRLLRSVFVPGDFVWEAELSSSFPREPYWYLYGSLKSSS